MGGQADTCYIITKHQLMLAPLNHIVSVQIVSLDQLNRSTLLTERVTMTSPQKKNGAAGDAIRLAAVSEPSVYETFQRALCSDTEWDDKDEFLDVVYWLRQILGVIMGIMWGLLQVKGALGIGLFLAINTLVIWLYFNSFQKVDEEEFGGITEILKEGLMTSFSSFLVSWIIVYSALHFE